MLNTTWNGVNIVYMCFLLKYSVQNNVGWDLSLFIGIWYTQKCHWSIFPLSAQKIWFLEMLKSILMQVFLECVFSVLWGRSAALAAGYLTRVKSQKLLAGRSECGWKDGRRWQMFSGQRQRSGEDHRSVVLHTTGVWIFCINTDFCIFWPLRDNPCDSCRSDFSFLSVTAWGFKSCLKLLPK